MLTHPDPHISAASSLPVETSPLLLIFMSVNPTVTSQITQDYWEADICECTLKNYKQYLKTITKTLLKQ